MPLFSHTATTGNYEISHERKYWPQEMFTKKKKILDPRNTQKKMFCAHEIPTRKKFKNFSRRNNGIMILDRRWHATHEIWYTLSFNTFFSLINLIIDKDSHAN